MVECDVSLSGLHSTLIESTAMNASYRLLAITGRCDQRGYVHFQSDL